MAATKSSATILEFDQEAIQLREAEVAKETDAEILARLKERFEILTDMTKAVKSGDVRAMIVSGPPGVGKSYGVESVLESLGITETLGEKKAKYEIVKGAMSALGLYTKLHEFSDRGNVIVFDDCDSILMEDLSLNILKGALDSSAKRVISWNTDSRLLRTERIPPSFDFRAGAIFITNIKFAHVRSKKLKDHLNALESRCHYIDLEMDTTREKILRIRQVVNESGMLDAYDFEPAVRDEIVEFIVANQSNLRELSLRTVLKVADLKKAFPTRYQAMARTTVMRRA
jgi:predicted AAA+ superfamily ATPase